MLMENEKRSLEVCRVDLDLLGYVPGCVVNYIEVDCDLNRYRATYGTSVRLIFKEDATHYSDYPEDDELYCKVLAIISSGQSVPLFPFYLAPSSLPWTFLKHELREGEDFVSAASPLVEQICADYICSDTDHIMKRFEAMLQITGGEIGSVGGRLLEQIVFARLHAVTSITYFYYDNGNTVIRSQELDLSATNKRDVAGIPKKAGNAKNLDFVFTVKEDEEVEKTHGIQVTFETRKIKCSKSKFYAECDVNYIYLLTPELVDVNILEAETARDNSLTRAFRDHHLRIIDPLTVLTSEQILLMRKCK